MGRPAGNFLLDDGIQPIGMLCGGAGMVLMVAVTSGQTASGTDNAIERHILSLTAEKFSQVVFTTPDYQ
ncbi:hypothetical protein [Kosakonia sp. MH5]|uniref:hypothetical protein n=1 Tax=Kosakonia sp. MH5 TaxID=2202822 RepID=UPI001374DD24|nr:hypothetical protein [Kosakonia sp. MH5]NCF08857.1 hypothetical protein [Kosakonia sp. MH5]